MVRTVAASPTPHLPAALDDVIGIIHCGTLACDTSVMTEIGQPPLRRLSGAAIHASLSLCELAVEVCSHWSSRLTSWLFSRSEFQQLLDELGRADDAEEWQAIADRLDTLAGNDLWRQNPESVTYDYKLIASRFRNLVTARKSGQREKVADIVRSGTLRNLGSIGSPYLYNHAFAGTKYLIEDYVVETIQSLYYLSQDPTDRDLSATERQRRLDFFHDTRQSFGHTALVLHGGSLFGLCHLGVVKALTENGLLPQVLIGCTVGAAVAALICSVPHDELLSELDALSEAISNQSTAVYSEWYTGSIAEGVIRTFYPPEILLFEQYVSNLLGDMTFEEAYLISGKILNIPVLPVHEKNKKPLSTRIFNYLTTPKVLIRSAIRASIGTNSMLHKDSQKVELLAKDYDGSIVPMMPYPMDFLPSNSVTYINARDSPYHRLSELFNVNNFIVSTARPYLAPVLLSDFKYRGHQHMLHNCIRLARTALQYRLCQLSDLGVLPRLLQKILVDENVPGGFQVNLVPEPESLVHDLAMLLDSHDIKSKVDHWIKIGERSVWPMSAILWTRTAIEYALDSIHQELS